MKITINAETYSMCLKPLYFFQIYNIYKTLYKTYFTLENKNYNAWS